MAEAIELKAEARDGIGKGAAREMRRNGLVPAIVYGGDADPEPVTVTYLDVWKQLQTGSFLSTIYMLEIGGAKTRVIPRDVQVDPVRDFPMHVDFLRLAKDAKVTVEIPVHTIGEEESPGVQRGGAVNLVRYTIELVCPADAIPDAIEIDVSALDINDSLHISDITLPDRVTPAIDDRDFTVLTIVGQMAEIPEDEEVEEPELIGEGEEGEEGEGEGEDGEGEGEDGEEPSKD